MGLRRRQEGVLNTTVEALWEHTCATLRAKLNQDVFARWIAVIRPVEARPTELILAVGNDFYQTWLEEHYLPMIVEAVTLACGTKMTVRFEVRQDLAAPAAVAPPAAAQPAATAPRRVRGAAAEFELDPRYVFESFVVGPSNSYAHASSMAVAQHPGTAYNPLFIYGGTGLGKTHLMKAIGHHALTHAKAHVCYQSCEALMNEFIDAIQNKTASQFRKKYRHTDVLLIDDIHFLSNKEGLQEEFFHTFNVLHSARKQIVMTSDRPAKEIKGLEERLVSRFDWGLSAELLPPDLETRIAILRAKQKSMNFALPENIIAFIAARVRSNIRLLESALLRVTSMASFYRKPLTLAMTEELLRLPQFAAEQADPVSITAVQRAVSHAFDVSLADLTGRHRSRGVTLPRQIAMYLCRTLTPASLPDIGVSFGKTHATVLHACRQIQDKMTTDAQLKQAVHKIACQFQTADPDERRVPVLS